MLLRKECEGVGKKPVIVVSLLQAKPIDMNALMERITVNPEICHGKPVIRNLRYPVELILDLLSSGMTDQEILIDYPDLELDDIKACLAYASRVTSIKSIHRIGA